MLTAKNTENDKILWLELWADDYIAKPFSPRELLARIKRIIKRSSNNTENNNNIIAYNDIKLKLDKKIVLVRKNIKRKLKNSNKRGSYDWSYRIW